LDSKQSEKWQSRISRTGNSLACFSLAYIIITYVLWFAPGLAGRLLKFDSIVYYYGVKFILNGYGWSKMKVVLTYSAGAGSALLLALLGLFLYSFLKKSKSLFNVFFLWLFVIGLSIFISQFIIASLGIYKYDSLYYQGLTVAFAWLNLPTIFVYLLGILGLLTIVYIGVNSGKPFLIFSYSYSKVNNLSRRRKYFFEIALVPYIAGSLITWFAVFPKSLAAKSVLGFLIGTHLIYIVVIGITLGIGWLSLPYVEVNKQDLVRYNSLQMPNIFFVTMMFVAWVFIYATFRGLYLTA
jgi:hypothetical protein